MCFDAQGNLWACAEIQGGLWCIDPSGKATVVVKDIQGERVTPNDVWVRPDGGPYFTDPEIEAVYYLSPDHQKLVRVLAAELIEPNGIVGTPHCETLYVSGHGTSTYAYDIQPEGTLANKRLFYPMGSDGMTIDNEGNDYLTGWGVTVFDKTGQRYNRMLWIGKRKERILRCSPTTMKQGKEYAHEESTG